MLLFNLAQGLKKKCDYDPTMGKQIFCFKHFWSLQQGEMSSFFKAKN